MKFFIFLFFLIFSVFGFSSNYTGIGDTSNITDFKADSMKYSRVFEKSKYQNLRVDVMVNDTSFAGYSADSVKFAWGIQTGHPCLDSANNLDTVWNEELLVCDTMSRYDSTYSPGYSVIGTDNSYTNIVKLIDTTYVTGFAVQTRNPSPAWDVLFRCWAKGVAGNEIGSFLLFRWNILQRIKDD